MLRLPDGVRVVLASASPYRQRLLRDAGVEAVVEPADIDERALDGQFSDRAAGELAVELARRKAAAVLDRHPGAWVIGADQLGVVGEGSSASMLTKRDSADSAVEQLMSMQGGEHRLVNGLVVIAGAGGPMVQGVDEQTVRMRRFSEETARRYVERFRPFDSLGCYRLEDEQLMEVGDRLISSVSGEDPSGVLGLPLPLLQRLFDRLGLLCADADP
jgi:septum formation protein